VDEFEVELADLWEPLVEDSDDRRSGNIGATWDRNGSVVAIVVAILPQSTSVEM